MNFMDNKIASNMREDKMIAKDFIPKLHNGSTDIIVIGKKPYAKTYRAFLEKRAVSGIQGKSWLFVEHNEFVNDQAYRQRLTDYQKRGIVNRLDVVFDNKTSVEDKLLSKSHTVYEWIEGGADFYVYGDLHNGLAKDIAKVLAKIVKEQAKISDVQADIYVANLKRERRFFSDVDLELGIF